MEWEMIDNYHSRAKVHGGWIVKGFDAVLVLLNDEWRPSEEMHIAMCFVPDPMGAWKL